MMETCFERELFFFFQLKGNVLSVSVVEGGKICVYDKIGQLLIPVNNFRLAVARQACQFTGSLLTFSIISIWT